MLLRYLEVHLKLQSVHLEWAAKLLNLQELHHLMDQYLTKLLFLEGVGRKEAASGGRRSFGFLGRKEVVVVQKEVELVGRRSFGVVLFAVGPRVLFVLVLVRVPVAFVEELEVLLS